MYLLVYFDSLFKQLLLHNLDVHVMSADLLHDGHGGGHPRPLARHRAGHHVPHGRVARPVARHRPPRHQQVPDLGRNHAAIGNLEISSWAGKNQDVVAILENNN